MKKKTKSKRKKSATRSKSKFTKFKKAVESYIGKVNWAKVSKVALVILILVATQGAFGPKAQIIASGIVDVAMKTGFA